MRGTPRLSLRLRLLLIVTLTLAGAVAITVLALSINARNAVLDQLQRDVRVLAQVLGKAIVNSETLPSDVETMVGEEMRTMALIVSRYVARAEAAGDTPERINGELRDLIAEGSIAEVWVTDSKGFSYIHAPLTQDFQFSPDARKQPQASEFWPLLTGEKRAVVQQAAKREIDERWFKYVGVGGTDKPRIVQVGREAGQLRQMLQPLGLDRLVQNLIRSGALLSLDIVSPSLQPLGRQAGTARPDGRVLALLGETISSGEVRTQVTAGAVEVFAPIIFEDRGTLGAFVVRLPRGALDDLLRRQAVTAALVGLLVILLGGYTSFAFADRLARPIARITAAARRVEQEDFALVEVAEVGERKDEIGDLARVFASMAREVESRERVLEEQVNLRTRELGEKHAALLAAQKLLDEELAVARALQLAILPGAFPAVPGCRGGARMLPAKQLGGDFYDYVELPDGRIGLVMADVSGKGVPAAFFMAVARTHLQALALEHADPGACLAAANEALCRQNPMTLFVTVLYAIYDPATGALRCANGGHNPPILRRASGAVEELPRGEGIVLGVLPGAHYEETGARLEPGDSLILFTDGVTEAVNSAGEAFGDARLLDLVARRGGAGTDAVVDALFAAVAEFAADEPQFDDITVAVLTRDPATIPAAEETTA